MSKPSEPPMETKPCGRCGQMLPVEEFNFVSKAAGTRRGQCKACMTDIKRAQRDPNWRPTCPECGNEFDRKQGVGGRRLCPECLGLAYSDELRPDRSSHRVHLKDCRSCGIQRFREDGHPTNSSICHLCRSFPQSRRTRLKAKFNMTPLEYLQLLEYQGYACWICRKKFTKAGMAGDAHVDHQHMEPSIIRAILCNTCNLLLAMSRDRPNVLRAAADMLEAPPAQVMMPGRVAHPEANRSDGYMKPSFPRSR